MRSRRLLQRSRAPGRTRASDPRSTQENLSPGRKLRELCIKIGACPEGGRVSDTEMARRRALSLSLSSRHRQAVAIRVSLSGCYCQAVTVRLLLSGCYCQAVTVRLLLSGCYCQAASTFRTSLITWRSDSLGNAPCAICGLSSIGMNRIDGMLCMPKAIASSCSASVSTL
jgi:hypothetical protein